MAEASLRILADEPVGRINPNIYGHFIEHLGTCVEEGIWVGMDSTIPNEGGIRSDVVEALAAIEVPVVRWPGGCFADQYDWRDGIGPRNQRPRRQNIWWQKEEDNHFGTGEFLQFCRLTGTQPYICGNVGSGTPREMLEWLEYCNYDGDTDLARLRAANGHPQPYDVTYWGVGNENYGCGGKLCPEEYARRYRSFATYLRPRSSDIRLIACGHDHEWNHRFLNELGSADTIDLLSIHHYYKAGHSTDFSDDEYYSLMADALRLEDRIVRDTHLIRFFEGDDAGRVGLAIDEWGAWHPDASSPGLYQQSTLRDALSAALLFDVFNRHCDSVHMTNIAQTMNVLHCLIQTAGESMWVTPTYHAYDLYRPHMDGEALRVVLECDSIEASTGAGQRDLPLLSASVSRHNDDLFITATNLHLTEPANLRIVLSGDRLGAATARILAADAPDATNSAEQPRRVRLAEHEVLAQDGGLTCTIPSASCAAISAKMA